MHVCFFLQPKWLQVYPITFKNDESVSSWPSRTERCVVSVRKKYFSWKAKRKKAKRTFLIISKSVIKNIYTIYITILHTPINNKFKMAEKLSELQLLEFKEAFTTFDKVYHNINIAFLLEWTTYYKPRLLNLFLTELK